MRIWLSTKEPVEYPFLIKDLCKALSAMLPEQRVDEARRDILRLEDSYSDMLLENLHKQNKAKEKALKEWRKAAASRRKSMAFAAKKAAKQTAKNAKKGLLLHEDEEDEKKSTVVSSNSNDEQELSAAITFPESFDIGIRALDDDAKGGVLEPHNSSATSATLTPTSAASNEAFSLEEEEEQQEEEQQQQCAASPTVSRASQPAKSPSATTSGSMQLLPAEAGVKSEIAKSSIQKNTNAMFNLL